MVMSIGLQLLNVAIGLIIPRMILVAFGSDMNGLVSSINQFMTYLTLVESGLTQVAVVSLYKPLVNNDKEAINRQLSATNRFYKQTAAMYLFLLVLMSLVYPLAAKRSYDFSFVCTLIIVLGIHYFIDFLFIGKYRVLFVADQKQYVISIIQFFTNIVFFISEIVLLNAGASIIYVKLVIPLVHMLQFVLIRIYAYKKYKDISFRENAKDNSITGRGSAILHQITGMIMSSTDITLLTVLGVEFKEISVYSVYNIIIVEINLFLNSVTSAIVPSFGKALVQQHGEIRTQFARFTSVFYFIVYCLFSPLLLLYVGFIELYTTSVNDVNYVRPVLALLFCLCFLLNSIKAPYIMLIQSSGAYDETKKDAAVEAAINIIITIPLIFVCGISGALVGTLCAHLYRYIQLVRFGNRKFSVSVKRDVITAWTYLILNLLASLSIYFGLITRIRLTSWLLWLEMALFITVLFIAFNTFLFYVMDKDNLKYYIGLLKQRMGINE